jgi:beta-lactamase regulating signal transducer with metallopeptidase domain
MSGLLAHLMATGVSVALLVGLVLMVRRPVADRFGAKAAYALWALPALRAVMPPLPSGWVSVWGWLLPAEPVAGAPESVAPVWMAAEAMPDPVMGIAAPEGLAEPAPVFASETAPIGWGEFDWADLAGPVLGVWLAGAVFVLVRDILRQRAFARLVAVETRAAGDALQARVDTTAKALGVSGRVGVRMGLLASGPMIGGLVRPVVILPEWFSEDYSEAEQHHALVHELTHVRRGDLWALQGLSLVRALNWYNPLMSFALPAFRSDQEAACDADVLALPGTSARTYGETLVKTARLASGQGTAHWPALAALPLANAIKERLKLMQNPSPRRAARYAGVALIALSGVALLSATASPPVPETPEVAGEPTAPEGKTTSRTVTRSIIRLSDGDATEAPKRRVALFISSGGDKAGNIVLLSDPFAALHAEMAARGEAPMPPTHPMPPHPPAFDGPMPPKPPRVFAFRGETALPGLKTERVEEEGGTRIIVPQQEIFIPKGAQGDVMEWHGEAFEAEMEGFEAQMEGFEAEMEAWEATHGAEMEAFETRMEVWGSGMEAIGDRMEAAGRAVEELADACEGKAAGTLVSATIEGSDETVRAACVGGVADGTDLRAYVLGLPGLTEDERAHVRAHPPGRTRIVID